MLPTDGVIVRDPDILGGTAVFRGTRVPFKNLLDYLEGGHTRSGMCCKQQLHAFAKKRSSGEEIFDWDSGELDPPRRYDCRTTTYRVAV
jgi:hypothetical protein